MNRNRIILIIALIVLVVGVFLLFVSPPFKKSPQAAPKRIGMLTASDLQLASVEGIKAGFKESGLIEGKDFIIDLKNPKGDVDLTKKMAQDIVDSKPDLIVSLSTSASRALINANKDSKIPMIAVDVGNFKELGIENVQHPGGFLTAVVVDNLAVAPKRMEILKTLLPNLKKIGILANPKHVSYNEIIKAHEEGARRLGIAVLREDVTKKEEIPQAMNKLIKAGMGAFMGTPVPLVTDNTDLITPLLKSAKIISIDSNIERGVKAGYLMVYGVARFETGRQGARVIDKVLKGENPGNIPVEFAANPSFEINAALAKEIGVKIPEPLLLQANKVYNQ